MLPAFNAELTLLRTVADLDRNIVDEVVLVDDASTDQTVALARRLGLNPIRHERNLGYGGNQKSCYRRALELGADIIVAANRVLTLVENIVLAQKLSEYHTGLRAFSRTLLADLPFERNSDDFIFDNQIIVQAIAAGARIGELSCPTHYAADSSSIDLINSIRYGFGVLRTCAQYRLSRQGIRSYGYLDLHSARTLVPPPAARTAAEPAADAGVPDQTAG